MRPVAMLVTSPRRADRRDVARRLDPPRRLPGHSPHPGVRVACLSGGPRTPPRVYRVTLGYAVETRKNTTQNSTNYRLYIYIYIYIYIGIFVWFSAALTPLSLAVWRGRGRGFSRRSRRGSRRRERYSTREYPPRSQGARLSKSSSMTVGPRALGLSLPRRPRRRSSAGGPRVASRWRARARSRRRTRRWRDRSERGRGARRPCACGPG